MNAPLPVLPDYYRDEARRKKFVRSIFDRTAAHYDRIERLLALGSGSWYRRQALERAGLRRGMSVLDVAAGTGLTARQAAILTGGPDHVVGLDPSREMLRHARQTLAMGALQALGERIPCRADLFDFLSMGYALRHLSDLSVVFSEFFRVLKPGGRICLLEITRPQRRFTQSLLKLYMKQLVPLAARLMTRQPDTALLMRFYWDTIEACVAPGRVLDALAGVGFERVNRHIELGIFSEYTARKPA